MSAPARLIVCFILLVSCQRQESPVISTFSGTAMTMAYNIQIGHRLSGSEGDEVARLIVDTFNEVNTIYNRFNPESDLSAYNGGAEPTPDLQKLITYSDEMRDATEGRFNPYILNTYLRWTKALTEGMLPKPVDLEEPEQLDLGGIAKGYAIDLIIERLQKLGYRNLFVEWGGEIRAAGRHPGGRDWQILIEGSDVIVALNDQAVATSGGNFQYWHCTEDGKTYCHIINPLTKRPLEVSEVQLKSVTVIAPTCTLADGLATALMTCENALQAEELAGRLQEQYPEITVHLR